MRNNKNSSLGFLHSKTLLPPSSTYSTYSSLIAAVKFTVSCLFFAIYISALWMKLENEFLSSSSSSSSSNSLTKSSSVLFMDRILQLTETTTTTTTNSNFNNVNRNNNDNNNNNNNDNDNNYNNNNNNSNSDTKSTGMMGPDSVIGTRKASRRRGRNAKVHLNSTDTLKKLKLDLMTKFQIAPIDQILFLEDRELKGDHLTLAQLSVPSGSALDLVVDDLDTQDINALLSAESELNARNKPETGFKGTGLLS